MLITAGAFPFIKTPAGEVVEVVDDVKVVVAAAEVSGVPVTVEVNNVNDWRAVMKNSWWISV